MTVKWIDGKPVPPFEPNDPHFDSRGIYRLTWEDQKRLSAWNWKCIDLIARELIKRREGK